MITMDSPDSSLSSFSKSKLQATSSPTRYNLPNLQLNLKAKLEEQLQKLIKAEEDEVARIQFRINEFYTYLVAGVNPDEILYTVGDEVDEKPVEAGRRRERKASREQRVKKECANSRKVKFRTAAAEQENVNAYCYKLRNRSGSEPRRAALKVIQQECQAAATTLDTEVACAPFTKTASTSSEPRRAALKVIQQECQAAATTSDTEVACVPFTKTASTSAPRVNSGSRSTFALDQTPSTFRIAHVTPIPKRTRPIVHRRLRDGEQAISLSGSPLLMGLGATGFSGAHINVPLSDSRVMTLNAEESFNAEHILEIRGTETLTQLKNLHQFLSTVVKNTSE